MKFKHVYLYYEESDLARSLNVWIVLWTFGCLNNKLK